MANHTTTLRIPEELTVQYDELARSRGLYRDRLMMDVLRRYLEAVVEGRRGIVESIAAIERGEFVSGGVIDAEDAACLEGQGYTPARIAAIDRQVDDELRTMCGVAPCV
jgi:predicted transcriptional regulator